MTGVAGILLIGLHNPVEMAEMVASLDVIWGGRFVFGIGLGYRDVEFDAFKVPRGQRVRRFEGCLEVVKRLWTEESVTVDNDVCTLAGVTLTCRPVQRPHPPIWVAANNDSAIRRAARIGDTWFINPHATMLLTAWSEGVGSNWVGFGGLEKVNALLEIPAKLDVLAILPFGYPAEKIGRGKKNRKPLAAVAHRERFGQPFG